MWRKFMNLCHPKKSLSEKVLHFQKTGEDYHSLLRDLYLKIYRYPRKKYGLSEDDCGNFYLYFFPQIKRIIHSYKKSDTSFTTYFNSVLFWKFRTYLKLKIKSWYSWETSISDDLWQPMHKGETVKNILIKISHNDYLADLFMINKNGKINDESAKRQLLILMLKKVKDLYLEDIIHLSGITGYDVSWLMEVVESLKSTLIQNFSRLKKFRERRNMAFWRLKFIEQQVKKETDQLRKNRLKVKSERAKKTMKQAMVDISRIRLSPTHAKIAAILNMPKGTIDSIFIRLKKKLKRVYKEQEKQYA